MVAGLVFRLDDAVDVGDRPLEHRRTRPARLPSHALEAVAGLGAEAPAGVLLVLAEGIFTVTDPPLRFLRRYIPPLRLGSVALDLSFMVLFFVVLIMVNVVVPLI